ncbi:MAG: hypothetical protein IIT73_07730, partial [Treponema sp.]|nr:hypothetical protein [Treponema sp.]
AERCIKKSLHVFFYDCRIALQFCTLLSRHPWLDVGWQERLKNPSMDFLNARTPPWRGQPLAGCRWVSLSNPGNDGEGRNPGTAVAQRHGRSN